MLPFDAMQASTRDCKWEFSLRRKKESEKRLRGLLVVVRWYRDGEGEAEKKIIISVRWYYVLSERKGRVHNPPVLPLEFELCSKSNTVPLTNLS